MDIDDRLHRFAVGKFDIVEKTAAQEGVGQFLFIVRRNDNNGTFLGRNCFMRFVNVKAHPIEFL